MEITLVNADLPSYSPVPPLGLLSLAQYLSERGHRATIRDYQLGDVAGCRSPEALAQFCDSDDPVLGISSSSMSLPLVVLAASLRKKKDPALTVVLGGIGASPVPKAILSAFPWIDYVVVGEGERPLSELMERLARRLPADDIPGVVSRNSPADLSAKRADRLNRPACLSGAMEQFIRLDDYKLFNIQTARGCPYPCTFCDVAPYWQRRVTQRPLADVLEEIHTVLRVVKFTPTMIFVDDTLTLNQRRVERLCDELAAIPTEFEWACYVRADTLSRTLSKRMADAGCKKVYMGLESGSDQILARTRKGFDTATGRRAATIAAEFFPIVQTSFMWGFPFETWSDFYDTLLEMAWLVTKGVSVKANLYTPLPYSSYYQDETPSIRFEPEYSPQLYLSGYYNHLEIIDLIRQYPAIFPGFYYCESENVIEKYEKLKEMGLSPEHIWDIWEDSKAPIPIRESEPEYRPRR